MIAPGAPSRARPLLLCIVYLAMVEGHTGGRASLGACALLLAALALVAPASRGATAAVQRQPSIAPQHIAIVVFENKDYDTSLDPTDRRLRRRQSGGAVHQRDGDPGVALARADARSGATIPPAMPRASAAKRVHLRDVPVVSQRCCGFRVRASAPEYAWMVTGTDCERPRPLVPEPSQPERAGGRDRRLRTRPQRHVGAGVRPVRLHGGNGVPLRRLPGGLSRRRRRLLDRQFSDRPQRVAIPMFYARKHSPLLLTWSQSPDALVVNDGPGRRRRLQPAGRAERRRPAGRTSATSRTTCPTRPPASSGTSPATSSSAGSPSSFRACATPGTTPNRVCLGSDTDAARRDARGSTAGWSSTWTACAAMWAETAS